jgi:hypothetical protein
VGADAADGPSAACSALPVELVNSSLVAARRENEGGGAGGAAAARGPARRRGAAAACERRRREKAKDKEQGRSGSGSGSRCRAAAPRRRENPAAAPSIGLVRQFISSNNNNSDGTRSRDPMLLQDLLWDDLGVSLLEDERSSSFQGICQCNGEWWVLRA